jgi:SPASM domain peptide maturase of grasp-with-spasm system
MENDFINKYSTWVQTNGYMQDTYLDIHNHKQLRMPKDIAMFINKAESLDVIALKEYFEDSEVVDEYIQFLLKEEICFFSNERDRKSYSEMSHFWDYPAVISNAIFDITESNYKSIIDNIDHSKILKNTNFQIRFFEKMIQNDFLSGIIKSLVLKKVPFIELFIDISLAEFMISLLLEIERGWSSIVVKVFNSPETKIQNFDRIQIIYLTKEQSDIECGKFVLNTNGEHFFESQQHNTCLNRKLCIDKDGYIKNCPNMEQHYGHISDTNIEEVIETPEFQKWWHIKKDDIDVCKDCEFRHMCTDCRAFIKDPENIYSQPAKCTYNPYICKWGGEEGYVPVEECGTYSRETGFVSDKKRIEALNKEIWGDE